MGAKIKWDDSITTHVAGAIDRLSKIVELPIERENINATLQEIESSVLENKKVTWISPADALQTGKETFRIILNYLRNYYSSESGYAISVPTPEHVKSIMALVGEAAKKLDRYTELFNKQRGKSATESSEYKLLQQFYQTRVSHQFDESLLGKWLLALAKQKQIVPKLKAVQEKHAQLDHVYIDLESVKKDLEYELFFIRKINGNRFFHPRLLRNLKLTCDFANKIDGTDPLANIEEWQDRYYQSAAQVMIGSLSKHVTNFYKRAMKCKESDLVMLLNKALMSLMLASYPENRLRDIPNKCCRDYFNDFVGFLTEVLSSHDYHKLITYPPKQSGEWRYMLLSLTHALSRALYSSVQRFQAFAVELQQLFKDARDGEIVPQKQDDIPLSEALSEDYQRMEKLFKRHPNGAMGKILTAIDRGCYGYDPLSQGNIPNYMFTVVMGERNITNLHLPSPTTQEYINKVAVLDHFRAFLRSYAESYPSAKHLLINLQDRSSWREHQRSNVLEKLLTHGDFNPSLTVATVGKETEFYEQLAPYDKDHEAYQFIEHFKEQLEGDTSGYFFSPILRREIIESFSPKAMKAIHKVFFENRNALSLNSRLDFIEIFDLFLILKLIDSERPDSISLTCKDGVDSGACCNVLLYTFLKMMKGESLSSEDKNMITMMLYAPSILVRERLVTASRFQRMLGALKTMELVYRNLGGKSFAEAIKSEFGPLFKGTILNAVVKN